MAVGHDMQQPLHHVQRAGRTHTAARPCTQIRQLMQAFLQQPLILAVASMLSVFRNTMVPPRCRVESLSGPGSDPASDASLERAAARGQNKMGPAKESHSCCRSSWPRDASPVEPHKMVTLVTSNTSLQHVHTSSGEGLAQQLKTRGQKRIREYLCRGYRCSKTASPPLLRGHSPC